MILYKMDDIWKLLPYELTDLILEQRCLRNIKERLEKVDCLFIILLQKYDAKIAGSFILLLEEEYVHHLILN